LQTNNFNVQTVANGFSVNGLELTAVESFIAFYHYSCV